MNEWVSETWETFRTTFSISGQKTIPQSFNCLPNECHSCLLLCLKSVSAFAMSVRRYSKMSSLLRLHECPIFKIITSLVFLFKSTFASFHLLRLSSTSVYLPSCLGAKCESAKNWTRNKRFLKRERERLILFLCLSRKTLWSLFRPSLRERKQLTNKPFLINNQSTWL